MTDLLDHGNAALDDLADKILEMEIAEARSFISSLDDDDQAVVENALARRAAIGWRATPATMAAHLTADGDTEKVELWPYVELLAAKFVDAVEGRSKRQVWMMPARYGKTLMASVWGPVWALDRYPWLKIILTSYGDDLAGENAGQVRDLLELHELRARVRADKRRVKRWTTSEGGGLLAAGVGSAMSGFGAHLIVVDDPIKNDEEAESEARRDKVVNWYKTVVRLRLQKNDSAIIIVGTRWHEGDLVGYLLDQPGAEDEWDVTRLPAIAEDADRSKDPKWYQRLPDPLDREPGEIIEPRRFDEAEVRSRARDLGSYKAAALEQQRPSAPEGTIIKREWWKFYGVLPSPLDLTDWLISWDMSFKDKKSSSYVVGQVWARFGARKYLIAQVRDQMDYPTSKQAVKMLAAKWPKARKILVEDKANGPAIVADLKTTVAGLVERSPGTDSKEARARAVSADIEAGNVFLPDPLAGTPGLNADFVGEFVEEVSNFPMGSHDDQVDAMTQALLEYSNATIFDDEGQDDSVDLDSVLDGRR